MEDVVKSLVSKLEQMELKSAERDAQHAALLERLQRADADAASAVATAAAVEQAERLAARTLDGRIDGLELAVKGLVEDVKVLVEDIKVHVDDVKVLVDDVQGIVDDRQPLDGIETRTWEFEDAGSWAAMTDKACESLEGAFQSGWTEVTIHDEHNEDTSWDYDLKELTQTRYWRRRTGKVRNIRRASKTRKCFRCGKQGHLSKDCRSTVVSGLEEQQVSWQDQAAAAAGRRARIRGYGASDGLVVPAAAAAAAGQGQTIGSLAEPIDVDWS
jgi:hypothetical protein